MRIQALLLITLISTLPVHARKRSQAITVPRQHRAWIVDDKTYEQTLSGYAGTTSVRVHANCKEEAIQKLLTPVHFTRFCDNHGIMIEIIPLSAGSKPQISSQCTLGTCTLALTEPAELIIAYGSKPKHAYKKLKKLIRCTGNTCTQTYPVKKRYACRPGLYHWQKSGLHYIHADQAMHITLKKMRVRNDDRVSFDVR